MLGMYRQIAERLRRGRSMTDLVELHTLDGRAIQINPMMVISMRAPQAQDKRIMHENVKCIVNFVDGKFITVIETCAVVQAKMGEAKP
jgi:hypothetical protein